ncbi:MAG: hypothetical protein WCS99_03075 [Limisphaerales bacterium]
MNPIALLSCLFVCLSLLCACHKKKQEEGAATVSVQSEKKSKGKLAKAEKTENTSPAPVTSDAPPLPPPGVPATPAFMEWESHVSTFVTIHRRAPESLEEVAQKLQIKRRPEAPPGKRFELVKDKNGKSAHVVEVPN